MRICIFAGMLVLVACTVNVYDYSSHSGAGEVQKPDTVYIGVVEPESGLIPIPPADPDTVVSIYPLAGGEVRIEKFGSWSRFTLFGCITETDGVSLEIRPVMVSVVSPDGAVLEDYQLQFTCRLKSALADTERDDSAASAPPSSSSSMILLPVVTGTELVTLIADRTSFPFLEEEALKLDTKRLFDGTLIYSAVYAMSDWKLRDICMASQLAASSQDPEFRVVFSDLSRGLLQQYYDIFVINDGSPRAFSGRGGRASAEN